MLAPRSPPLVPDTQQERGNSDNCQLRGGHAAPSFPYDATTSPLFQGPVRQKSCGSTFQVPPEPNPVLVPPRLPPSPRSTSPVTWTPAIASHLATLSSKLPHNGQRGLFPTCPAHKPRMAPVYLELGPKPYRSPGGLVTWPSLIFLFSLTLCCSPTGSLPDHQHTKHTPLQGLCTCCSHPQEHSSSVCLTACSSTSFRSLLKCYLVGEAFPTTPSLGHLSLDLNCRRCFCVLCLLPGHELQGAQALFCPPLCSCSKSRPRRSVIVE